MSGLDHTDLGKATSLPQSPDEAVLHTVPAPQLGQMLYDQAGDLSNVAAVAHRLELPNAAFAPYLVRFSCPEFTSLCPVTGQPDFAHLVIDYVPIDQMVESKALKLLLGSYRNHGAFHEECTLDIGIRIIAACRPRWLRISGFWYPRGGIPIDVFWQTGEPPAGLHLPPLDIPVYRAR